jgi:hypothetical protein
MDLNTEISTSDHYKVFLLFHLQSLWNLGTKNSSGLTPPAYDWLVNALELILSKSKSHCDWRSISKSSCWAPSGDHDQIFITVWQLRSCFCGAPSLTRGRLCLLYMLLALASALFLGSLTLAGQVKVKVTLGLTVSQSVSLGVEPHLGLMTRYLVLFDSYGLVFFVGCPLWREDGSVFCQNHCLH